MQFTRHFGWAREQHNNASQADEDTSKQNLEAEVRRRVMNYKKTPAELMMRKIQTRLPMVIKNTIYKWWMEAKAMDRQAREKSSMHVKTK